MNELEKLLNKPEGSKPIELESPKLIEKPTPAANKARGLAAQDDAIALASVGSAIYRSAAALLAANSEIRSPQHYVGAAKVSR